MTVLGWQTSKAVTIHKSQGSTYGPVYLEVRNNMPGGLALVGISRPKTNSDGTVPLRFAPNFDPRGIKPDPNARDWILSMEARAEDGIMFHMEAVPPNSQIPAVECSTLKPMVPHILTLLFG